MSSRRIDIFDEEKISRLLDIQKLHSADFEKTIPWAQKIDIHKCLLPLDKNAIVFPEANSEQRVAISQMMGLIVASTISELETIAYQMRDATWLRLLKRYPVNPEILELGEHFYEDEASHARAFNRYLEQFAESVDVDPNDLRTVLPSAKKSLSQTVYRLNSMCGGVAIWWLIAAVEEESIHIFDLMRNSGEVLEPLYYELHRLHFEEELRHKSYAHIMLNVSYEFQRAPHSRLIQKIDFLLAEVLNFSWSFKQLLKVKGLKRFKNHSPFFDRLNEVSETLTQRSSYSLLRTVFTRAPYTSDALRISKMRHIAKMREQFGTISLNELGIAPGVPIPVGRSLKCSV